MTKHGFTLFVLFSAVASTICRHEKDFCESKSCNEREFEQNHFYPNVKTYGEIALTLSHKLLGKIYEYIMSVNMLFWILTVFESLSVCCTDALPLDEVDGNVIRTVKGCVFSDCKPTPLKEPLTLAAVSQVINPLHLGSGDIIVVTVFH